jgi:hypothetical protein
VGVFFREALLSAPEYPENVAKDEERSDRNAAGDAIGDANVHQAGISTRA